MKRKYQKSSNGNKPRRPAKKTIELFPQKAEDDLSAMKRSKSKDEVCESSKTPQRNLRTRTVQNYSERSKVLKATPVIKDVTKSSPEIVSGSRVPIYKTIKLEEEKVQNLDSIYEFIDDMPGCDQKVKKRKKSVKKPSAKRAKKLPGFQYNVLQKTKVKAAKNVSKNLQSKEQKNQPEPEQSVKRNIYANIKIPEHLKNAGDSTIAEASTIIITDQQFQQNDSSSLNQWTTTFQLDTQESSMSNHSLIAQSISPIAKEVNNLFIGSPRKTIDAFSQVQNVTQSTPQRVLSGRDKKQLLQMNLNQKSLSESENQKICSEDPIHLSSTSNEKLSEQNIDDTSQIQKESISPRKFGSVISNVNSAGTTSSTSDLLQQKQQSQLNVVSSSTSFDDNETDQVIGQDDSLPISSKKPSKVKVVKVDKILNPLKFDNILQSYKLMIFNECLKSNPEYLNCQKENKHPDSIAGPSNPDSTKSKAVILRQSNLNNFLNLDEVPESTSISTVHGIFSDVNNSTVNGKKLIFDKSNIENQFDINNSIYTERSSPIKKSSIPIIATARDVARSVKGKLFVKARVKSSLTRRVPESMIKKTLLKNAMQESASERNAPLNEKIVQERNVEGEKNNSNLMNNENKENAIVIDSESARSKSLMGDKKDNSTNFMQDQIESNVNLVENINEKSTNIILDQNENNVNLMENENEKFANLMQDENENNINLMDYENEKIPIFMEDENENIAYLMENQNENNAIHMEEANKEISLKDSEYIGVLLDSKKAFLDSISFSDTFDFLPENGEDVSLNIPEDLPIFVDLEPIHFSQPPRRSYTKSKKATRFNRNMSEPEDECSEEDDCDKPKKKRKRISKLNRQEQKRMQEWIRNVNERFREIEEFNLTVE